MKRTTLLGLLLAATTIHAQQKETKESGGYPITPVTFTNVKVEGGFWGQRLEAGRKTTIPLAFGKCEETGRYTNFTRAAEQLAKPEYPNVDSGIKVEGFSFDDTDVYKTIEGASYMLQTFPDKKLVAYIDSVLDVVATAQEPDGYLNTSRTQNPLRPHAWMGPKRWSKVEELSHEFYNLGHMVEGAVAHYQATGSDKFLNIARRYADCVCANIGPDEDKLKLVPGHQIAEMALAKLYLVTGESKYLTQAKFFLDMRGKTARKDSYSQAHLPVVEQSEAVGHAVRAAYMYAGMADVAALTGDSGYIAAIGRIWENIVSRKLYITGGIGATSRGEAFGRNYELPNMTAYCETCAAIGNVYVNHRLFLLHGESKYYDVLERSLYNGLISGVSLDGGRFFYPNPLESHGQHERQPWFGCACCPSNISRFIPSLPGYVYAVKDRNVYVNLFLSNTGKLKVDGRNVTLSQETDYPWEGRITLTIDRNNAGLFALKIRVPGWMKGETVPSDLYSYSDKGNKEYSITVNGERMGQLDADGYYTIERKWKKNDRIAIDFPMEPRSVQAHQKVAADRGSIAIERGPLVYCAEFADNDFDVINLLMPLNPTFNVCDGKITATDDKGITTAHYIKQITSDAQVLNYNKEGRLTISDVKVKLIPYYGWNHRGKGNMRVWLPQQVSAAHAGEYSAEKLKNNGFFGE